MEVDNDKDCKKSGNVMLRGVQKEKEIKRGMRQQCTARLRKCIRTYVADCRYIALRWH